MGLGRTNAQLVHLTKHRHPPAGDHCQHLEQSPHGQWRGVVAVVDQGDPGGQGVDSPAVGRGLEGRNDGGHAIPIDPESDRRRDRSEQILRLVATGETELDLDHARWQVEAKSSSEETAVLEIAEPRRRPRTFHT